MLTPCLSERLRLIEDSRSLSKNNQKRRQRPTNLLLDVAQCPFDERLNFTFIRQIGLSYLSQNLIFIQACIPSIHSSKYAIYEKNT